MNKKCDSWGKVMDHSPTYGYSLESDENPAIVEFLGNRIHEEAKPWVSNW
jgi:hypothetical protein